MSSSVIASPDQNAPQGHCSHCKRVWTLKGRQGVCSWCNKPASCITATSKPRQFKSRSNVYKRQATVHSNGYDHLEGEWLTYYKANNGLDCHSCSRTQRQKCRSEDLYRECPKAIKLDSLNKPIIDSEGHTTELGELIAEDKALDLDAWVDARTFLLGFTQSLID